jgi:CspA family cold shock protein
MSSTQETSSDTQTARLVGQVKWFNNKAGYGFITVSDGEQSGKDIFIHYSTIRVTNSQYKYLVQGEYVEFTLTKSTGEAHEFQAGEVSGIKGGALMCETRRVNRSPPGDGAASSQDAADGARPAKIGFRARRPIRGDRGGDANPRPPRGDKEDGGDFTTVRRRKPAPKVPRANKTDANA